MTTTLIALEDICKVMFTKQVQDLEDAIYQMIDNRSIFNSYGIQLDGIGDIVGLERNGLNDIDYKIAIYTKIAINTCTGSISEILQVVKLLTYSENVQLIEDICRVSFAIDGIIINQSELISIIEVILPAGVRLGTLSYLNDYFGFDDDVDAVGFLIDEETDSSALVTGDLAEYVYNDN
jgi:hypothetical protein